MFEAYSLLDKFEFKGSWRVPEHPNEEVPGTLYYNAGEDIRLELMGSFGKFFKADGDVERLALGPRQIRIVLGVSQEGRHCTLLDVYEVPRLTGHLDDLRVLSVARAQHLFVGSHFSSEEDLRFSVVSVRFSYLEEWVGRDPFGFPFHSGEGPYEVQIPYTSYKIFGTPLPSSGASLSLYSAVLSTHRTFRELSFRHRVYVTINTHAATAYSWYYRVLFDCR